MCPVCAASATWMFGSVAAGGIAALVVKASRSKKSVETQVMQTTEKEK